MKFVKTGEYREDTLQRLVEINALKEARNRLKKMDYLLGFVRERKPEDFPEYINNLLAKYQSLLEDNRLNSSPPDLDDLVDDFPNMIEHPELVRLVLNYFIQILRLPTEDNLGKSKVINKDYFQSYSHISYPNLLVLTETIGRAEAIAFS